MFSEKEKINKSVLTANSIEASRGWSLSQKDNPLLCYYCKSPLFYIEIIWGIVEELSLLGIKVLGDNHKSHYSLREVGFNLYCAECGKFEEHYDKYFYPEDKLVCSWNDKELNLSEKEEISHCLSQFNQKGDFTPNYKSSQMMYLKNKLKEYELKLPKHAQIKKKNRRLFKRD